MKALEGKYALITGGNSGVGFGVARNFMAEGANITIAGIDQESIQNAVAVLQKDFPDQAVTGVVCDITDEPQVVDCIAGMPQIDVLVANAGSGAPGPILELDVSMWRYVNELNITGTALCIKHAGQRMKDRGGAILTISSVAATRPAKWMAPYSTTKAGVEMLSRCAAVELAPFGIRVNCIAPGFIVTEATTAALTGDFRQQCLEETLLGRFGEPQEIGAAATFLCSENSGWVTGQVLAVDGGLSQHMQDFEFLSRQLYGDELVDRCKPD